MRRIGFSTGAVARGDFRRGLEQIRRHSLSAIELSALRAEELGPLIEAIPELDLSGFSFVSIHAPSRFPAADEVRIAAQLIGLPSRYPIVVHPDAIRDVGAWAALEGRLLIENMDKRKPIGRTVSEIQEVFRSLPKARLCFDIGHARQVDPSMTEASLLLRTFADRLAEVHMSEVNTASRHEPLSLNAVAAFSSIASLIPEQVPIILETLIDEQQSDIPTQVRRALEVFSPVAA
jgi:hypothetical protein